MKNKKIIDIIANPISNLEYVFNFDETNDISIANLDSDHAIIAYSDGGSSGYGTAIIATISGLIISYGSKYIFNSALTKDISIEVVNPNYVIISYKNSDGSDNNVGAIISGDIITYDKPITTYKQNNDVGHCNIAILDDNRAIVVLNDNNRGSATIIEKCCSEKNTNMNELILVGLLIFIILLSL